MSKSNSDELYEILKHDKRADTYVIPPRVMEILVEHIEAEYSEREQALADLIIGEDETYEGHQMVWSIEHRNQLRAEQRKRFSEHTGDKT